VGFSGEYFLNFSLALQNEANHKINNNNDKMEKWALFTNCQKIVDTIAYVFNNVWLL